MLLLVFQAAVIAMPYGNFDDNFALKSLYHDLQDQDPDLDVSEFLFGKLLVFGQIFDDEEDDVPPQKQPAPSQPLQIQQGYSEVARLNLSLEDKPVAAEKPFCRFIEDRYSGDFRPRIFHPPSD